MLRLIKKRRLANLPPPLLAGQVHKRRSLQELVGNEGLNSWGPWAPRLAWAAVIGYFYVSIRLWASWALDFQGFQLYFWYPAGLEAQRAGT